MASAELTRIVKMLRSMPRPESPTLEQLRHGYAVLERTFPPPADVSVEEVSLGGVPARRLGPPGADPARALLFVHGGGFVMGSPGTHLALATRIARAAGVVAWLPDYRLAPEHPFPAGLDDCVAAYHGLLAQGLSPERVALAGDSAGGGLVVSTLVSLRDAAAPLPAAAACLSPWVDLTIGGASVATRAALDPMLTREGLGHFARLYLGGAAPDDPLVSPIFADLSRLPPLLVQVGTADVLHDDAVRLAARARDAGVEVTLDVWEEMIHVWHAFSTLVEAEEACAQVGRFLRGRLG